MLFAGPRSGASLTTLARTRSVPLTVGTRRIATLARAIGASRPNEQTSPPDITHRPREGAADANVPAGSRTVNLAVAATGPSFRTETVTVTGAPTTAEPVQAVDTARSVARWPRGA